MRGGLGDDTYIVDNLGDVVDEFTYSGDGTDHVFSSVDFDLRAVTDGGDVQGVVEKLTLTGTAVQGTGNDLDNVIIGNGFGTLRKDGKGGGVGKGGLVRRNTGRGR